jgi:hypothetical protein
MTLDLESLKAQAIEKTGLADFGSPWFEGPLAAWVHDLQSPALSERGRAFFTRLAVTNLCRRLEVIDCLKRNPEIAAVRIPPILYITGLERSGTTLLHNLLALHPLARPLLRWELMFPTPPPEAATYRSDPRLARVQASIEPLRGSKLEHMHWVNADEPEECTWGAYDCTGLLGRAPSALMPTWTRWIQENDLTPSYVEHRRLIQLLTWRNPVPAGGHLVLKCPQNSRSLQALVEVFPEARLIFTHRDPFRAWVSGTTLVDHITSAFVASNDLWRPGGPAVASVVKGGELALKNMIAMDETDSARAVNVAYPALAKEPLRIVRETYRRFAVAEPADLADRISAFLAAQAQGKRAAPASDIGTYGLEPASLRARPTVAAYCARFGVVQEATRITGT